MLDGRLKKYEILLMALECQKYHSHKSYEGLKDGLKRKKRFNHRWF
jgi:hypothetical protein